MTTTQETTGRSGQAVRLVYHYTDGHEYTTDVMPRAVAMAYMPVLQAKPVDAEHYEASFGTIELRAA